jgi:hypothetical protein
MGLLIVFALAGAAQPSERVDLLLVDETQTLQASSILQRNATS